MYGWSAGMGICSFISGSFENSPHDRASCARFTLDNAPYWRKLLLPQRRDASLARARRIYDNRLAMVEDLPTNEQWRRLYEAAVGVKELAPWEWMTETDVFGVQDPETEEIGFVNVMGMLGEHFGVSLYPTAGRSTISGRSRRRVPR